MSATAETPAPVELTADLPRWNVLRGNILDCDIVVSDARRALLSALSAYRAAVRDRDRAEAALAAAIDEAAR